MGIAGEFSKGLWKQNPIFRLVLGMCPTLAVTTLAINGIGMGLATTFVLVFSNIFVSMLRQIIPPKVRIAVFIVIIASFVIMVELLLQAFFYSLYQQLGLFIPLIVVNCIILGRAEAFASRHPVLLSAADGLGMGLGFTLSLTLLGMVREFFGSGAIFGVSLLGSSYLPFLLIIVPSGAFITLGLLLGAINSATSKA